MKLVFATGNQGKVVELRQLLADIPTLDLVALGDIDPPLPPIEESGTTFVDNAIIKAEAVIRATGLPALADDSGLEVDVLGGAPGVHSARYGGPGLSDTDRVAKLLEALRGTPTEDRTARFRCAVAYAHPDLAQPLVREGSCEGRILEAPRGEGGFGYDPVFYVEELGATFAEAAPAHKHRLSHRGRAMRQIAELLLDRVTR